MYDSHCDLLHTIVSTLSGGVSGSAPAQCKVHRSYVQNQLQGSCTMQHGHRLPEPPQIHDTFDFELIFDHRMFAVAKFFTTHIK